MITHAYSRDPEGIIAKMVERFPQLAKVDPMEILDLACGMDMGIWSEHKRGFTNADYQWHWYDLAMTARRLCVLAPREHAKSEIFSVNLASWKSIYTPGHWTYIFCNSGDQGEKILGRAIAAIGQTNPELLERPKVMHTKEVVLSNDARITVRGSGAAVRGAHPDLIIGDDVQDENNTATQMQRDRLKSWWFGTVGGMAHPGTKRPILGGARVAEFDATRIILVGTPFHALDLLMGCKDNEMYTWKLFGAISVNRTEQMEEGVAA